MNNLNITEEFYSKCQNNNKQIIVNFSTDNHITTLFINTQKNWKSIINEKYKDNYVSEDMFIFDRDRGFSEVYNLKISIINKKNIKINMIVLYGLQ